LSANLNNNCAVILDCEQSLFCPEIRGKKAKCVSSLANLRAEERLLAGYRCLTKEQKQEIGVRNMTRREKAIHFKQHEILKEKRTKPEQLSLPTK